MKGRSAISFRKLKWMVRTMFIARAQCGLALMIFAAVLPAQQNADIRVDVDLVTVPCAVATRGGAPARDLKAEDFRLQDDGQPRPIQNFWQESDLPLTVALVADVSGSQAGYIRSHRDAVAQFLRQVIGPRDRAMVVQVAQKASLLSSLSLSLIHI